MVVFKNGYSRSLLLGIAGMGLLIGACSSDGADGTGIAELGLRDGYQTRKDGRSDDTKSHHADDRTKIRVKAGPLEVELRNPDGTTTTIEVPVPDVEVEVEKSEEAAKVEKRLRTPKVEVEIPEKAAKRAHAKEVELELRACDPANPKKVRTPAVDVEIPDDPTKEVPRKVRVPITEVKVPEGSKMKATRVKIPAIDQEVADCKGAPRRVKTPAIDVGLPDVEEPEEGVERPVLVRVPVPDDAADAAERVRISVSRP